MIGATKHASGIMSNDGVEILPHIELDTVRLSRKGFDVKVSNNQTVKNGDKLIEFDEDFLKKRTLL